MASVRFCFMVLLSALIISVHASILDVSEYSVTCQRTSQSTVSLLLNVTAASATLPDVANATGLILSYFDPSTTQPNISSTSHIMDLNPVTYWSNGDSSHTVWSNGTVIRGNLFHSVRKTSFLQWPRDDSFILTSAFSVMIWVKPIQSYIGWVRVIGKGGGSTRNYGIYIYTANGVTTAQFIFTRLGTSYTISVTRAPIPLNQWTHLAGTWSRTNMSFYINGILSGWRSANVVPDTSLDSLYVGFAANHTGHIVLPQIAYDGAVLFNRNITNAEVIQAMELTKPSSGFVVESDLSKIVQLKDVPHDVTLFRIQPTSNVFRTAFKSNITWFSIDLATSCPRPVYSLQNVTATCSRSLTNGSVTIRIDVSSMSSSLPEVSVPQSIAVAYFDPRFSSANAEFEVVDHISQMNPTFFWHNGESSHPISTVGQVVMGNFLDQRNMLSFLQSPDEFSLGITSSLCVMGWIKPHRHYNAWARFFGKGASSTRNYGIWYHMYPYYLFQLTSNGIGYAAQSLSTVPLYYWTHVAGVLDTTNSSYRYSLYVNGTLMITTSSGQILPDVSSDNITIGNGISGLPMHGFIDGTVLFNRSLTLSEVRQAMAITQPSSGYLLSSSSSPNTVTFSNIVNMGQLFRVQAVSSVKNGYSTIPVWFNASCVKPPVLSVESFVEHSCTTSKEIVIKLSNLTFTSESASIIGRYYTVQYLTDDFTSSGKSNIIDFYGLVFSWSRGFSTKPVTKNYYQQNQTFFDRSYATFAQVSSDDSLRLSSSFTIMMWVKPSSFSSSETNLLAKCSSTVCNYAIRLGAAGTVSVYMGNALPFIVGGSLPVNVWTHISVIYDGSVLTLYYNISNPVSYFVALTYLASTSTDPILIGGGVNAAFFDGFIDGISIFERSLVLAEIEEASVITNAWLYQSVDTSTQANTVLFDELPLSLTWILIVPYASTSISTKAYVPQAYWLAPNILACNRCTPGNYAPALRSTTCLACNIGTYTFRNASTVCDDCNPGSYSDVINATVCTLCQLGRSVSNASSTSCQNCTIGEYADVYGLPSCKLCPRGLFNNRTSASICFSCPFGTFSDELGKSVCSGCPLGTFQQGTGLSFCEACSIAKFASEISQSTCQSCTENSTTTGVGSSSQFDCGCNSGFYGQAYLGSPCTPCPTLDGIECYYNNTLPYVLSGYYRDPNNIENVFACIPSSACPETGTSSSTTCSGAYTGPQCGECATGYRRRAYGCEECPSEAVKWIILFLAIFVAAFISFQLAKRDSSIPVNLKIAFRAFQMLALFPNISAYWPDTLSNFLSLLSFANIDIDLVALECSFKLTYWDRLYLKLTSPLILTGCVIVYGLVRIAYAHARNSYSLKASARKFWGTTFYSYILYIILLLYTLLSASVISPFECVKQQDGSYFMLRNPSVACYGKEWNQHLGASIFFILVWALFVPIGVAIFLFSWRNNLDDPRFFANYDAILTRPYRKTFYFWEFIETLKRFVFVVGLRLLPLNTSSSFASASFFVCCMLIVYIVIDSIFLPYKSSSTAALALLWNLVCIVVLISNALVFQSSYIDITTKNQVGTLVLISICVATLYTLLDVAYLQYQGKRYKNEEVEVAMDVKTIDDMKDYHIDLQCRSKIISNSESRAKVTSIVFVKLRTGYEKTTERQRELAVKSTREFLEDAYFIIHRDKEAQLEAMLVKNTELIQSFRDVKYKLNATLGTVEEHKISEGNGQQNANTSEPIPEKRGMNRFIFAPSRLDRGNDHISRQSEDNPTSSSKLL